MLETLFKLIKKRKDNRCAAIIVAAGKSSRMQGEDKIAAELFGKTVIERSIEMFQRNSLVHEIVVVTRKDLLGYVRSLCGAREFLKVKAVVEGGETRVDSVMNGLEQVSDKMGLVAVHDGARPLVSDAVIDTAIKKAQTYRAAAPAIPVKDTIKLVQDHFVTGTPDRSTLFAVQTPQIFDRDLLHGALHHAKDKNLPITDDCSAVEAIGMRVYLSEGDEENIKITTPIDLVLAEAILKGREEK